MEPDQTQKPLKNENNSGSATPTIENSQTLKHTKVLTPLDSSLRPEDLIAPAKTVTSSSKKSPSSTFPNKVAEQNSPEASSGRGFWSTFISEWVIFLISLIVVFALALFFGLIFPDGLISKSSEYMGDFADYISVMYVLPLPLIVFGIASLVTRNWTYVLYPLLVFTLAQAALEEPITHYLASSIPIDKMSITKYDGGAYPEYLAAVVVTYLAVHFSVYPMFRIWRIARDKSMSRSGKKPIVISMIVILAVGNGLWQGASVAAKPLLIQQARERNSVLIPTNITGVAVQEKAYGSLGKSFTLYYTDNNNQYIDVGSIEVNRIKKWWDKDTHNNCGDAVGYSYDPAAFRVMYNKTPQGIPYGAYVDNHRDPGSPVYNYCFVAGYFKYNLERLGSYSSDPYSQHPVGRVIDDIQQGEKYMLKCSNKDFECSAEDEDRVRRLVSKFDASKLPKPAPEWVIPGVKRLSNSKTYTKVGELKIPEWGVAIPLARETQSASIGGFTQYENQQFAKILLTDANNQQCILGSITRIKADDIIAKYEGEKIKYPQQDPPYRYGTVVDGYVYDASAGYSKDECTVDNNLRSIVIWSNINLYKI